MLALLSVLGSVVMQGSCVMSVAMLFREGYKEHKAVQLIRIMGRGAAHAHTTTQSVARLVTPVRSAQAGTGGAAVRVWDVHTYSPYAVWVSNETGHLCLSVGPS